MDQDKTPLLDDKTIQKVSKLFKVISDPTRIAILYLLENQELNVGTIAKLMEMEQSAVSHQLKILKTARLVKSRSAGKSRLYSQMDDHVYSILNQGLVHTEEEKNETNTETPTVKEKTKKTAYAKP
ncbi:MULTISPECIES: ArsR/SmtB family transcription factor [Carnobacterium]|uniref:ArsR/SmtB family transcription factor n=1 Tax=Carnobacterium antarcticum TaxID=2126436 RepID=A0ABW4NN77_9LACT|nr:MULTISPECIES: metalloregulator ArsR/SmtB family transcription factor [unclassified Carnobacterium]ALV22731.1 Cadmium efflux system accessory protein [Carnobacterium sp. CP1]QQP70627.1 winged helix-turn-helix transcriptional regulator [Carnobacterium sp. CS13]